jgi:hypothetical protein
MVNLHKILIGSKSITLPVIRDERKLKVGNFPAKNKNNSAARTNATFDVLSEIASAPCE